MKIFRQHFCILLFTVVLTNVQAQDLSLSFPEKEFATPEAALQHVVDSIAKHDAIAALEAFAINPQAEKFDFAAMSKRLGAMQMAQLLSPSEYPMYVELNRLELASRYAVQIKLFSYSLLVQTVEPLENFDPYQNIRVTEDSSLARTFVTEANPEKLKSLTMRKLFKITATSDKMLEAWQSQTKPIGADEITEFVVLYELGSHVYLGGARVLRFGRSWKLDGLNSAIAGIEAGGSATLTTQADFELLIDKLENNDNWGLEELQ
ncbi:MAG: hypothetical protein ACRCYY_17170 [Trueperaceae bacterium]